MSEFAPATAPPFSGAKASANPQVEASYIIWSYEHSLGVSPGRPLRRVSGSWQLPNPLGPGPLHVKTGHTLNSPRRKPAIILLHVTHIHGLARMQRRKRPGYPHIAAEREIADAVPWVPRPQKLTDYRAGDLLRIGNHSHRRKKLCIGLW